MIESVDVWRIWLDFNVVEFIGGYLVKNVLLCYFICVVCYDVDKEINFWGLVLDCDEMMCFVLLIDDDIVLFFLCLEVV